jgi:hypothetical protein
VVCLAWAEWTINSSFSNKHYENPSRSRGAGFLFIFACGLDAMIIAQPRKRSPVRQRVSHAPQFKRLRSESPRSLVVSENQSRPDDLLLCQVISSVPDVSGFGDVNHILRNAPAQIDDLFQTLSDGH